jgi:ABC-type phosphate transport system substrate-binding protein
VPLAPLALALALTLAPAVFAGTTGFQVVVHPSVHGARISRASLAALFTGRTDRWGDKTKALPVDQSSKAPVRRAFASSVIGLSIGELQMFWQRRVVSERVFPPPIKDSDDEVIGFVAANAGAVGYVSAGAAIPGTVKVVAVVD